MKLTAYILAGLSILTFTSTNALCQDSIPRPSALSISDDIANIISVGMDSSRVMETLWWLTEGIGPRLTGSPAFKQAAEWARAKLSEWGLENARLEGWGPFGRGWSLERYSAHVVSPYTFPLISFPRAWSPGTDGKVTGDVVYVDAKSDSALDTFRGKLKGRFVVLDEARALKAHFEADARRHSDSSLLLLANAGFQRRPRVRFEPSEARKAAALLEYRKLELCVKEGAAALLEPAGYDGGNIAVLSAAVPSHPDTPRTRRPHAYDSNAPEILPQVAVGAEHYNLILRLLRKGKQVRIEMDLDVKYFREDSGYNVIAEIPGTDLRDELVMIGAHLDSWHGGTGTTDNGTGVASCMEATRILKLLDLKPRRTIRIALWGGEEQGVLGSRAYVKRHFGERADSSDDSTGAGIRLKPEGEKFSVYFNNDNGTGKIRGVYMEGNEAVRPIFREWLDPFEELGASTLTLRSTGSTDHIAFNAIGLPGFQFIQDPVEYWSRTWHSTMDVFDRALEDDLKQASVIMAAFAYNAAMRDEPIPRKPPDTPERRRRPGRTLTPGD